MNVLFVCTGNTCRSPMAQYYLNSKKIRDVRAKSAGFSFSGDTASENAVAVMKEKGIDISPHRSRILNAEMIENADRIICMSESHKKIILSFFTSAESKISVLGGGIFDPYGGDISAYRACRDEIIKGIDELFLKDEAITVKRENGENFKLIAELEKATFSSPWSENMLKDSLKTGTVFFSAFLSGTFCGYAGVKAVLDEGYITNIAVKKEFRNKGVGSSLLNALKEFAKEKSLSFLTLEVRASNETAVRLYKKFGFIKEGVRKDFYIKPTEDALILTRRFKNEDT